MPGGPLYTQEMSSRAALAALLAVFSTGRASAVDCEKFTGVDATVKRGCAALNTHLDEIKNAHTPEERKIAENEFKRDRDILTVYGSAPLSMIAGGGGRSPIVGDIVKEFENERIAVAAGASAVDAVRNAVLNSQMVATVAPAKGAAPSNPLTAGAQADLKAGDPAAAVKKLDQALGQKKDDPEALSLRAQAKLASGDRDGALADARRAGALRPDDPETKALLSGLEGSARASAKLAKSKFDFGAQREPEGGFAAGTPSAGPGRAALAPVSALTPPAALTVAAPPAERALIQRVRDRLDIGDLTGALLPLREAIDLDPKRPELWDLLAETSNKLGSPEGAVDAAGHALALDPKDARALRARSYAEFQLGLYREALADAEQAVALEPGSGLGYLYRAMAEEKLGDAAKALADYQIAVRLDPTLAPLANDAIKRLGGGAVSGEAPTGRRAAFRVGAVGLSTLLVLLGLMGTAAGRNLTRRLITPLPPPPEAATEALVTIAPGALLGGHYRVTRELGRGGMGVVYLAQDETLQRPVAIKQLQREIRGSAEDLERFLREARLVAQLKHPHMAQIHAVIADGDLLLVFEFVDGEPLERLLSREKRLAPARARLIVGQVCDALQYAHERKIVHRDLKPANVMIDAAGSAKVMDFGIAHQSRGAATMTKTQASGTPPYMSPEQGFGSVSKASDLYALGVMTYEMLTGARPFEGPDFLEPKLRKEFSAASSLNPALGPGVDEFFSRALDPDPTKRPADAAAFALALGRALDAAPSRA
jgi:tetratricopeptide (TPR) repeat protein